MMVALVLYLKPREAFTRTYIVPESEDLVCLPKAGRIS